jgi:hypothetical protein
MQPPNISDVLQPVEIISYINKLAQKIIDGVLESWNIGILALDRQPLTHLP